AFYHFLFSRSRRHTISKRDWSSDVCSSDLRLFDLALIFPLYLPLHSDSFKSTAACVQVFLCLLNLLIDIIVVGFFARAVFGTDRSEERRVGKECISHFAV